MCKIRFFLSAIAAGSLFAGSSLLAQPIAIPNGSFESQSGVGQPFGVNVFIDSWQKPPNPGYPEGPNFQWIQSAGVFVGTSPNSANPYSNLDQTQAAFVISLPGAGLFQDSQSTDWSGATNGLNALYQTGKSYQFTLGVFGKGMVENYSTLQLSMYYRDNSNNKVFIGTPTSIVFSTSVFNPAGPFTLVDYSVTVPTVQASDAWAGKNIGLEIDSTLGTGDGYWDMDNARLTAVPEPTSVALATLAFGGMLVARARSRHRA